MIRGIHLNEELKKLDNKAMRGIANLSDILKGIGLIIKVLSDVKSNQVAIMKSTGVELRSSYKKRPINKSNIKEKKASL